MQTKWFGYIRILNRLGRNVLGLRPVDMQIQCQTDITVIHRFNLHRSSQHNKTAQELNKNTANHSTRWHRKYTAF
ncbi:uncharacterized protein isoform X2 [Choristoneura fumiferana]|uniref:uncharacterized protein isoform X2 n=1 Tax=Choristoneura fumiferana TaxID=7141 RepID=UPI003D15B021